ncbi:MAG TPA: energy transducer TonB [Stellaceae bacterium]|nr:energy transducer TonB [Stellaceae bacterium]
MQPDELREAFEINTAPIWPADDDRLEPIFLELEEAAVADSAPFAEFEALRQLDPDRGEEAPDEPLPALRRPASATGLLGSLGVHLLVLLGLLVGYGAPAEVSGAIPVQLVLEKPHEAADEPQPAQSASESTSETAPADRAAAAPPPERSPPPVAAARPPPKPQPPPQPAAKPVAAAPPPPTPLAPAAPAAAAAASPPQQASNPAPREPGAPGPSASRGDYLDYLVTLTRGHFDLLPLSFLAGRRGRTILSVLVFEDGTISRVSVKHSSGYPDIDARIGQMVVAVGRFPPVPDSFRKPSVELDFNLAFPDALQQ